MEVSVQAQNRKRTISASIQGTQKAEKYPDIDAGICEYCGHPSYKCGKCGISITGTINPDDNSMVYPTHCVNKKCGVELQPEWYLPLAFCEHYRDLRDQIACVYCRSKQAVGYRRLQVRGITKPDGSEELVIICSDINCRQKHFRKYSPQA